MFYHYEGPTEDYMFEAESDEDALEFTKEDRRFCNYSIYDLDEVTEPKLIKNHKGRFEIDYTRIRNVLHHEW